MTAVDARALLAPDTVREFAERWYRLLDVHAPEGEVVPLVHPQARMVFPEATLEGVEGFKGWYHDVTHRFFDEVHTVTEVTTQEPYTSEAGGERARVTVVVNWQARIWDAPAAKSAWLGFDAYQSWEVAVHEGALVVSEYVVDRLDPMPGSAAL